jgi:dipeptidyl aminopeptidase/acylaminoacyl peptidase
MKKCLCHLGLAVVCAAFSRSYAQDRAFAVRDDIAMVRFNDPSALVQDAAARFSPDGKNFAVVTSSGLITTDQIESTLSIFSSDDSEAYVSASTAANAPLPQISVKFSAVLTGEQSDAYGAVITDLRWSEDSHGLYFLAGQPNGNHRLYRVDVNSGKAIPLTPEDVNVARFDFMNGLVVCSVWRTDRAGNAIEDDDSDRINSDAKVVTGESIRNILFPHIQPAPTERRLVVVRSDQEGFAHSTFLSTPTQRDISWLPEVFSISPTGHMLIQLQPLSEVPSDWNRYEPKGGYEWFRISNNDPNFIAANSLWRLKQYSLVNLGSGNSAPLIRAPHDYALMYPHSSKALWSLDEKRVLLTNTFLSLDGVSGVDKEKRLRPCGIADVTLPSREAHCIVFMSDLGAGGTDSVIENSLAFGKNDDEVVLTLKRSSDHFDERRYAFLSGHWQMLEAKTINAAPPHGTAVSSRHLKVTVRQALNEPPTLWVRNTLTAQSKRLWDPNPQFADLKFGVASVYRWRDRSGYEWNGGLVKPVGYTQGVRYPLVIQIYNFNEKMFLTDGLFPTAMAARHLASSGIVVLQMQRKYPHTFDMAEANAQLEGIESAIDHLADEGLVDPQKVGLVGFSATCWYVEHALIKAPERFKAATIADGSDMSYMQYRLFGAASASVEREYDRIIGAKPVGGDGLKQWLAASPGFNLDRITVPVRIEAITPASVLAEWELYSSLRMQRKPVDLIYFPDGQHIHQKPRERLESQQGDVDWFRFWLQRYEDSEPAKRDQYRRWGDMRHADTEIGSGEN